MTRALHLIVAAALVVSPAALQAQAPVKSKAQAASPAASAQTQMSRAAEHPISVEYYNVPLRDVVRRLAAFSGRTIVLRSEIGNPIVNASLGNVHWRRVLDLVLESEGLVARDDKSGIITIERRARIEKRAPPRSGRSAS